MGTFVIKLKKDRIWARYGEHDLFTTHRARVIAKNKTLGFGIVFVTFWANDISDGFNDFQTFF
jgi:hypothetical protein